MQHNRTSLPLFLALCFALTAHAKDNKLTPVPIKDGTAALSPSNSRIDFVGEHEGAKPDPRKGSFAEFKGQMTVGEDNAPQSISFTFETASLQSEIPRLTAHLKSPDFFDVREHPKATFTSTSIKPAKKRGDYEIAGTFELLGNRKEIKVPATIAVDQKGLTSVSKFQLDRTQFGMNYGVGRVKKEVSLTIVIGDPTPSKRK